MAPILTIFRVRHRLKLHPRLDDVHRTRNERCDETCERYDNKYGFRHRAISQVGMRSREESHSHTYFTYRRRRSQQNASECRLPSQRETSNFASCGRRRRSTQRRRRRTCTATKKKTAKELIHAVNCQTALCGLQSLQSPRRRFQSKGGLFTRRCLGVRRNSTYRCIAGARPVQNFVKPCFRAILRNASQTPV